MKLKTAAKFLTGLAAGAGAATLVYGALVESKRLQLVARSLELHGWPKRLDGYKIAVLADLHLRDQYSVDLAKRAVAMALDAEPDAIVLAGDLVGYWKPGVEEMLMEVLEPLILMSGAVIGIPGNHEYWSGVPERLAPIFDALNIKFLKNSHCRIHGISWIGLDSLISGEPTPLETLERAKGDPQIVIWHECDAVDLLPPGSQLMIAGHSHGGQFKFPGGFTPMFTKLGKRYPEGFYPHARTPLYVSRGVGTTGPPSRLNCRPEVSLLTLRTVPTRPVK